MSADRDTPVSRKWPCVVAYFDAWRATTPRERELIERTMLQAAARTLVQFDDEDAQSAPPVGKLETDAYWHSQPGVRIKSQHDNSRDHEDPFWLGN